MILTANEHHINYQRIEQAIKYLEENFLQQPELDAVAEKVHLSPFHFQRIFTEWAGISPKRFLQFLTNRIHVTDWIALPVPLPRPGSWNNPGTWSRQRNRQGYPVSHVYTICSPRWRP